eukprot:CAMPEP_0115463714 /NCGR_PEP_ID=MMETSP0271-20121206/48498_1 /TAXON_ID=71861 /ORGANISM="Scrippsiella trochoidea, Strain CCMP3099" /LENGTH=536 /DNA_ID=CAMNT_0002890573 /DNA_START=32 /DNA_END=1639 /DNA_ORIENTATION=-
MTADFDVEGMAQDEMCPTGSRLENRSLLPLSMRSREVVGRLRVRCVSGTQLAAADGIFQYSSSDPYAVLQLRDHQNRQASPCRRTRTIQKTLNPLWREEFWFAVRKSPDSLVLHVDVYDYDYGKDDDFLGQADLPLDWPLLRSAVHVRQVRELMLKQDPRRSKVAVSGSIKLEISWEPSLAVFDANLRVHLRALLRAVMRSPNALRVFRVGLMGSAGLLLYVAANAEWICRGTSFADCSALQLSSATTSSILAAISASVATTVHFLGSAGMLGANWRYEPMNVVDLAEDHIDHEGTVVSSTENGGNDPTIQMQVSPAGVLGWNASLATSLMPKISLPAVYLFTFFIESAAIGLSALALLLAWLHLSPGRFFAEGAYLDAGALFCLTGAAATSYRERRLCAEAERDKWLVMNSGPLSPRPHRMHSSTGGSGDTPVPFVEDLSFIARQGIEQFEKRAEELTKPLLDARQRFHDQVADSVQALRRFESATPPSAMRHNHNLSSGELPEEEAEQIGWDLREPIAVQFEDDVEPRSRAMCW